MADTPRLTNDPDRGSARQEIVGATGAVVTTIQDLAPPSIGLEWRERPARNIFLSFSWFATLAFGWEMINNNEYLIAEGIFVISAGIFFCQVWSTRTIRRSKLIGTALGILIFGFCTVDAYRIKAEKPWSNIWAPYRQQQSVEKLVPSPMETTSAKPKVEIEYYSTPLSLREIFESDFQGYMRFWRSFDVSDASGNKVRIVYDLIWDYQSRTKFMSFFIPKTDESFFHSAIQTIFDDHERLINSIEKDLVMSVGNVGDTARTSLKESIFSKQIYIYYENRYTLQRLAAFEFAFTQKGIAVQFRGDDYRAFHQNDKREVVKNVPR